MSIQVDVASPAPGPALAPLLGNSISTSSKIATALQEMEVNGKRILKEVCSLNATKFERPKRKIVVRSTKTVHYLPPPPITCVVTERCPTPDQLVDAVVCLFCFLKKICSTIITRAD